MLTPEYLLRVSEGGEVIAETLHDEIIKQIIDRIAVRLARGDEYILTARDKWQLEVLQDAGYLREDIEKILAEKTGLMQTEIAEAMEDAGVRAIEYDNAIYRAAGLDPAPLTRSPYLVRLMQRTYEATLGEWINFTRTTADACQQAFIRECDKAYTMVASGASGYGQAYIDAINGIVDNGGVKVTYPSGHTDTIETATLRCIRTGVSQATGQITDARMEEMNWDIILVSSHLGARVTDKEDFTNHYWWQGKFYSKSGSDPRFQPYSVCGQGNVRGIHGANCRHQHGPGDGEFNPFKEFDSEENKKAYELEQRQRTMERRIRESERKCMGLKEAVDRAETPETKAAAEKAYQKQADLLNKRGQAYKDFCKDNNLKQRHERITIAKWDREQAKAARVAANKARKSADISQKTLAKSAKNGTMVNSEMYSISDDARKDFRFISDKRFDALTVEAKKKGAIILRGTPEIERHLDAQGAAASTVGDVMMFKRDVCISEVLEETHHFNQNLNRLNDDKGEPLRTILNEIDAKEYIISAAKKYQIPRNELEHIQRQLAGYKSQLENYRKGG